MERPRHHHQHARRRANGAVTTLAVSTGEATFHAGGTFGGVSVDDDDVLVMYTWAGDCDLNGVVDAVDYGTIDNWIQFPGTNGYANGDLNYDGVIDAVDYGIIDNSIQLQGDPFPTGGSPAGWTSTVAVPEPGACGFALLAVLAVRRRRRRRRYWRHPS